MNASEAWKASLEAWAIPQEILDAAPESPWGFAVDVFVEHARKALAAPRTVTHRRVDEALPRGGVLLDVGCGAGAASLPLAEKARLLVAVDPDAAMLQALAEEAAGLVSVELFEGGWPDVVDDVPPADVAVCANVTYNVPELGPFVAALSLSARDRVVLEMTANHPQALLSPLWQHFWGLERPSGPTADDALVVIRAATGAEVSSETWSRPSVFLGERGPDAVARVRRRLCLPPEADREVDRMLASLPDNELSEVVTMWWPGSAVAVEVQ